KKKTGKINTDTSWAQNTTTPLKCKTSCYRQSTTASGPIPILTIPLYTTMGTTTSPWRTFGEQTSANSSLSEDTTTSAGKPMPKSYSARAASTSILKPTPLATAQTSTETTTTDPLIPE